MANDKRVTAQVAVAKFVSASGPIERHLLEGKPLTDVELDSIANISLGFQMAIEVWKRTNGLPIKLRRRPS